MGETEVRSWMDFFGLHKTSITKERGEPGMSSITFRQKGDFSKTKKFLERLRYTKYQKILEKYAKKGVEALASATPVDSGVTAASWSYEIIQNEKELSIFWKNSNVSNGVNIALILQYGHATRNGGYVAGRDYINPALQPIFDELAEMVWKEVTSA